MENNCSSKKKTDIRKITFFWSGFLVAAAVVLYLFLFHNPTSMLYSYLNNRASGYTFLLLMAILPLAGFPISIFLILVGMIFGLTGGIILTGLLMLFHVFVTYYLVHSLFRPQVIRLLRRFNVKIPKLPHRGGKRLSFIFMIIPGPPYAVKNYLLALAGLNLKPYILISWIAQFGTSIPFIILGKGVAELNPAILVIAVSILLLSFIGQYYLQKRYNSADS